MQPTQYSPIVEESETLVIFNVVQGWMRIGSSFYCRGDELVHSLVQFLTLCKQEFLNINRGEMSYKRTVGNKEVLAGLLLSLEQCVIQDALKRLQAEATWKTMSPAARMIRGRDVIGHMGERCRNRFELHGLTTPTLFSQTGDPDYLKSLLETGERLVHFNGQHPELSPLAREAGYTRESSGVLRLASQDSSVRIMGSGQTMPARAWRIVRTNQTVPGGYREIACRVDNTIKFESFQRVSIGKK